MLEKRTERELAKIEKKALDKSKKDFALMLKKAMKRIKKDHLSLLKKAKKVKTWGDLSECWDALISDCD